MDDVDDAVADAALDVLRGGERAFDGDAGARDGGERLVLDVSVPDEGVGGVIGVVRGVPS